ncbi:hypothetical protein REPUB_Repub12eG0163100 [Reevesia pubescens]
MPAMGMVPNVVTYTTILGGYVARGDMGNAKRVFGELLDRGWIPDAMTYTILMNEYCRLGKFNEAVKVRMKLRKMVLFPMRENISRVLRFVVKILEEMLDKGCLPNKITYAILVEGLRAVGKEGEVGKVVSMAMSSRRDDRISWDLFLTKIVGKLDSGVDVLDQLLLESDT